MTTFFDVPSSLLVPAVAEALSGFDAISAPQWSSHVKTGVHRERPPTQQNWWEIRAAAVLRKIAAKGPIGVNHLAQEYGGSSNRGSAPNSSKAGSRHVIRSVLQQLEQAGLVEKELQKVIEVEDEDEVKHKVSIFKGRRITGAGQKLLDATAHELREVADGEFPGLDKY